VGDFVLRRWWWGCHAAFVARRAARL
jgi:hypothetical protein